jgi:acyl-CoA synthetase (AMP-forming)/AMP-acid ligase II
LRQILTSWVGIGGEKISPLEVDSALLAAQGVGEAVSFGVPDKMYGEAVWACVVPKSGQKVSEKDIIADVAKRLTKVRTFLEFALFLQTNDNVFFSSRCLSRSG